MMMQMFFGSIAFSLCLIAFAVGVAMTTWACNNCQIAKGAKAAGYFILVLAILSLIVTTFNLSNIGFMQREFNRSMMDKKHMMMKKDMKHGQHKQMKNKPQNGNSNKSN